MAAIPFSLFKNSCEDRGYTERVYEEQNNCVLFTNNGVKCEIKKNHYTVGWLARPEDVAEMRKRILAQGFTEKIGKRSEKRKDAKDFINIPFDGDVLENFWIIIGTIEAIETIVRKVRGQAIKPISREVSERNIFEKIAKRFKYFIDNEDGFGLENTRALLEGDSIDHLITIGESVKRTKENTYREHIVPCILIYNQAVTMTMEKRSVAEVAQMIKNNLAIVLITNEEAELLDNELDMQTSMPENWQFGDSVFARLDVAKIQLK
jgi:sulfur transfer complex TusBCD TusB component (DsrH family)